MEFSITKLNRMTMVIFLACLICILAVNVSAQQIKAQVALTLERLPLEKQKKLKKLLRPSWPTITL